MQDLIETLFCDHPELAPAIARSCFSRPDFVSAQQEYEALAAKIAGLVGFELFDEFETRLWDYVSCEIDASYRFGLGLRSAVAERLGL